MVAAGNRPVAAVDARPTQPDRPQRRSNPRCNQKASDPDVDLFEYQGKQYFARYDIPVSRGGPADTVDEAVKEANQAGYPVVVKAQVQVGGRGKAGGIKLADNEAEVREHAGNILCLLYTSPSPRDLN